jgi:UDP-perosamine 4-acetyltransferase
MKVVLAGAGGHGRAVLDALRSSAASLEAVACTDPDPETHGSTLDGVEVIGDDSALPDLLAQGVLSACLGLGGTADNRPRARLYEHLLALGFELPAIVHGFSHVASSATLEEGSVVLAGAVVGAGARIAADVIVGARAVVEHDCQIAAHVHLASGCVLGGDVGIGWGAHVGLGASILQGRIVGERAIVGAGAVVTHDVGAGETVVGCPARTMVAGR